MLKLHQFEYIHIVKSTAWLERRLDEDVQSHIKFEMMRELIERYLKV